MSARGKTITLLDKLLKARNIALTTKVCIVKIMFFPVVWVKISHSAVKGGSLERLSKKNGSLKLCTENKCWESLGLREKIAHLILDEIKPLLRTEHFKMELKLKCFGHNIQRVRKFKDY